MEKIKDDIDNSHIDTKRVDDNYIMINGKEYFSLSITNVVKAESESVAKENFNKKTQKHHPWFILDLETGGRKLYPGCKLYASTAGENVPIKESRSDYADTIIELAKGIEIEILERFSRGNPYWYMCKYESGGESFEGYVRESLIENLEYR